MPGIVAVKGADAATALRLPVLSSGNYNELSITKRTALHIEYIAVAPAAAPAAIVGVFAGYG